MFQSVKLFLALEAAAFLAASLVHFGIMIDGYQHQKAGTAEGVIGLVLLAGLVLTLIRPLSSRTIGLAVQAFALLGTFVGLFTIAIGVGPQTKPDILLHIALVTLLVSGLVVVWRSR
jgi:hypothetical protein